MFLFFKTTNQAVYAVYENLIVIALFFFLPSILPFYMQPSLPERIDPIFNAPQ